jgi:TRAP-type C4-dicarboxylate transport system permease small subunit
MSMREKVAWISVIASGIIFGWYFWTVWSNFLAKSLNGDVLFWRFVKSLIAAVVIMLAASLFAAWRGKQEFDPPKDELDRAIDHKSNRIGLFCLELSLVLIVLGSSAVTDMARADYPTDPAGATAIMLVNLLLFVMAACSILREILTIVQYRRYA